ncbi:O-antigen translocase [Sulfitobacter sp. JB4-11]|uniref:O-antigen translocase n=1 Tax=Sulfitobacter rhodophyticola TaxID=3238304 RepID=UPI003D817DB7
MTPHSSETTRGLIQSMLIIGSTQLINIALSILRQKLVAVLLGPAGIGLLGIFSNFQGMGSQAAGLGMSSSGVREIASARKDPETLGRVRFVLLIAHLVQGTAAVIVVWVFREPIATALFGAPQYAMEVGLVGVSILIGLVAAAHTALLQGLRQIGDLGRVTVIGAFASTIVGLLAIWLFEEAGLVWFILAQPLFNLLAARYYVARLNVSKEHRPSLRAIPGIWLPMARLGFAFMLAGLATSGTLLIVRGHIAQTLGLDAAGQFAAAWGITMVYVGFLLSAMSADYYPRLTEVIQDKRSATTLMNDQSQLGLAIGGPVLLLLIGWAPWVIALLYSEEFAPAVELLQWQSIGNVFKLASWPLSFSVVAAAKAKTFFSLELTFNIVFLAFVYFYLADFGLIVTAIAFLAGYMVYFAVSYTLARNMHGYRMDHLTRNLLISNVVISSGLLVLALASPGWALWLTPVLAAAMATFGLRAVLSKVGEVGRMATRLIHLFARIGWPIRVEA